MRRNKQRENVTIEDLCLTNPRLLFLIEEENKRQLEKWGVQICSPFAWHTFLAEEVGETAKAISEYIYRNGSSSRVVFEAIQAATLSLKIAEMFLAVLKEEANHENAD